jgi:hypothetical protein
VACNPIWKAKKKMNKMFLRNKKDGFIYGWNEILANNPLCEPVTEEEAFPERFVKPEQIAKVKKSRSRRKGKPLDLSTDDIGEELKYTAPEIEAEASKGLPE